MQKQVTIARLGDMLMITDTNNELQLVNATMISTVKPSGNSVHIFSKDGNGYHSITIPDKVARQQFHKRLARVVAGQQTHAYIRWLANGKA